MTIKIHRMQDILRSKQKLVKLKLLLYFIYIYLPPPFHGPPLLHLHIFSLLLSRLPSTDPVYSISISLRLRNSFASSPYLQPPFLSLISSHLIHSFPLLPIPLPRPFLPSNISCCLVICFLPPWPVPQHPSNSGCSLYPPFPC